MSANQSIEQELADLWFDLVSTKFPTMTCANVLSLRIVGATDWCVGHESEAATLFEKFVMMKTLKELKYEDEK